MTPTVERLFVAAAVAVVVAATGCQVRALVPSEADAFRDEIRMLKGKVADLERANAELEGRLAVPPVGSDLDPAVRAHLPIPVRLKLGWGAALEPDASNPGRATLRVYLETVDARGHFVQATGWLDLRVFTMPALPDQPHGVGSASLGPGELRDLYRSGLTGTHYTIELPVDVPAAGMSDALLVQANFRDGLSGKTLAASTVVPIPR